MKNIAIVGCGNMGGGHALAIGLGTGHTDWQMAQVIDPEIEAVTTPVPEILNLSGIYDIDPRRRQWASDMGFYVYDSLDAVLADEKVDIVLVATPNHLHAEIAIRAMRAGKHVLCEKPVTPTAKELEEVLKVSRETGKVFYPRQNRRWDADFLAMKYVYDNKLLGSCYNIQNRMGGGGANRTFGWRSVKKYGGGMMLDWGVHLIDRLLIMNPSKINSVVCQIFRLEETDVDEGFNLTILFEDGFTAYIEAGIGHTDSPSPAWRLNCQNGVAESPAMRNGEAYMLQAPPADPNFTIDFNALPTVKPAVRVEDAPKWFDMPHSDIKTPIQKMIFDRNSLYRNLVNTIEGKEEQLVTGEQALRVLKLMEAAFLSAETNKPVSFE